MVFLLLATTACFPNHVRTRTDTLHRGRVHVARGRRVQFGQASWYGKDFHGRRTANGEIYNMYKISAAHKTLPLGTRVRVTNRRNGKSVVVRINDRGPFVKGRIIDLSYGAAKSLDMVAEGVVPVKVEVLALGDNQYYKPDGQATAGSLTYTVQVGSFLQKENALALKRSLAGRFGNIFIREWDDRKNTYYRVRIGRFSSEEDARNLSRKLEEAHLTAFVTAE
jgi:rare lipoprotein A